MSRLSAAVVCIVVLCGAVAPAPPAAAQRPDQEPPGQSAPQEAREGTEGPVIQLDEVQCVPRKDNGLVRATIRPEVGGADVRLYFRWDDHGEFYYVIMDAAGASRYWATPPKPTDENHQVEYYVAVVTPEGTVLGRSEPEVAPVTGDCDVALKPAERGMAENLVVGETVIEQQGREVLGFLCDGIISRIGPEGVLRADGICRRCIVAWFDKPEALVPAAVLLGGGTVLTDVEASPSRP